MSILEILQENRDRRNRDAERFHGLDDDTCMACHARGPDKRSLRVDCFYAVHEVVPEAIDLGCIDGERGYYLRVCKACRAAFLGMLGDWWQSRIRRRDLLLDSDGHEEAA